MRFLEMVEDIEETIISPSMHRVACSNDKYLTVFTKLGPPEGDDCVIKKIYPCSERAMSFDVCCPCSEACYHEQNRTKSSHLLDFNPSHRESASALTFSPFSVLSSCFGRHVERTSLSTFHEHGHHGCGDLNKAVIFFLICLLPYVAGFNFSVRVLALQQCDPTFLDDLRSAMDNASETLRQRRVAREVNFSFEVEKNCLGQPTSPSLLANVFEQVTGEVTVGVASYDLQLAFAVLADLFKSPYIVANTYTSSYVSSFAFSLHPGIQQTSRLLRTILTEFQWQEVTFITSESARWLALTNEAYIHLASSGFRVKGRSVLPLQFSGNNSRFALQSVLPSTKAVILLMDINNATVVLTTASELDMATSHAFIVVIANPYDVRLDYFMSLKPESNNTTNGVNILNSVFVVSLQFSDSNSSTLTSVTRRRRSAEEGFSELRRDEELDAYKPLHIRDVTKEDVSATSKRYFEDLKNVEKKRSMYNMPDIIRVNPDKLSYPKKVVGGGEQTETFLSLKMNREKEIRFVSRDRSNKQDLSFARVNHRMDVSSLSSSSEDDESVKDSNNGVLLDCGPICSMEAPHGGLRSKRAASMAASSHSDVLALYDIVLLLGYALNRSLSASNNISSPEHLLSQIRSLDFEGSEGRVVVDGDNLPVFDAVVWDYSESSGSFVKVMHLSATSAVTWHVSRVQDITWPGGKVLAPDDCFLLPENCNTSDFKFIYIIAIFSTAVGLAIIVAFVVFFIKRYWAKKEMTRGPNKVILSQDDLIFILKKDMNKGSKLLKSRTNLLDNSKPDLLRGSDLASRSTGSLNELSDFTQTARYNGDLVHVKELKVKSFEMKSKVYTFIRMLRDLRHENLNPYVGFLVDPERPAIVTEYCSRGSLKDMLHNEDIKLDWDFKLSLLTDLVRGLRYIHGTPLRHHGHLTSMNCVIDSRFVLKITDYGIPGLLERSKTNRDFEARDLLWTAPELLRDEELLKRGTDKGDIYSISIIFQEVALRSEPYSSHVLTPEEIIKKVKKPPPLCRPSVSPQAAPPQFIQTMKMCWSEMPDMRPSVEEVYEQFKKLTGGKKANIVDTMFKMLEKYSNDLEDIVAERTMQLEEEKKKTDQLLFRMLPSTVAESLKMGRNVQAEQFSEVTIYFSDIVGFTTISARSTPMEVVDLLNDLYTMFDATIELYDVYKVETIGDAYMVVSGLPIRNGNRHAGEISTMALDLLSQCGHFTIRHMPAVPLRLRIGLHTGPCVAGVVGLTMPRYCLFGDTVNTASRMESTGAAFRVHVSQDCKNALDELGGYHLDLRGETELKGKGKVVTYWLVGKEGWTRELPKPPPLTGEDNHGLASLFPELSDPSVLFTNSNATAATSKDASTTSANEHAKPEPFDFTVGGAPPRGTEGEDSGRGESSDGDSPLSPKTSVSCVQPDPTLNHVDTGKISRPSSARKETIKTDSNYGVHGHNERSPNRGGNSKGRSSPRSSSGENGNGKRNRLQDRTKGSNCMVTEAEIYPEAKASTPEKAKLAMSSVNPGSFETDMCDSTEGVEMHPLLASDPVAVEGGVTTFEMLDEKRSGRKPLSGDHYVKRKAGNKDGGTKPRRAKASIDNSTNSVVSASDVRLQGDMSDTASKLLQMGDSEDLTPVTEV